MSDHESSENDWEECDVEGDYSKQTTCLFCNTIFSSPECALQHCQIEHKFDVVGVCKKASFDAISYIKLINYIRIHHPSVPELQQMLSCSSSWLTDLYMKPAQMEDPLLTYDIEGVLEDDFMTTDEEANGKTVVLPKKTYDELLEKVESTKTQLENAWDRIERMKEMANNVLAPANNHVEDWCPNEPHDGGPDSYYFSSYDHFGIHHEMLQDKVRTLAYREAILNNKELFANKKVMDLGCGTAILSLFAAKAGASKVFAVDKSDVIYQAMDIIRENGYDDEIDVFKGRVEDADIPNEKVDIIISEWMGYFLLFEGMLDSVLYARDKYLAPNGHLFPDRCSLSIAAISDSEKYSECVDFWDDVYGFKMSVMKREVVKEANVEAVKGEVLCSNSVIIKELDLMTCNVHDTEFASKFDLEMSRDCRVTALVGFFDCMFDKDLNHKVVLSTSPLATQTHWKQTIFLLPRPIEVKTGELVSCRLSCRKNRRDPRTLIIKINFGDVYNQYYLA